MKTKITTLIAALLFVAINTSVFSQNWLTTGNTGTNPASNFLGTIDNKSLVIRTRNIERLRITNKGFVGIGISNPVQKLDVNGNINIPGSAAFYFNNEKVIHTTGGNFFVGQSAGNFISGGTANTGIGNQALYNVTTGTANTALGWTALGSNTTGSANTGIGWGALVSSTVGYNNTAVGSVCLRDNTNGHDNTASGSLSLLSNTVGYENAAFGSNALVSNTSGHSNAALGSFSMYNTTTGLYNTASGTSSLYSNTTGSYNAASGSYALFYNTTGSNNTAFGYSALISNTMGDWNTASGTEALGHNTSGSNNTSFGDLALHDNVTGYGNSAFGSSANVNADDLENTTAIGFVALTTASNQVRVGNTYVTSIGGYTNWSNISDGRVKKNIKMNVPGLAFINRLKPITYNLDLDAADKIVQAPAVKTKDGKIIEPLRQNLTSREAKKQVTYTGFVAQDVEKAAKELNFDFSGVDAAKNDKDLYGLRYAEFVVPLVKAVQELSAENEELKARLEKLEQLSTASSDVKTSVTLSNARIEQNTPNPFNGSTVINYYIPPTVHNASLNVIDVNGKVLKTFTLNAKGNGQLILHTEDLTAGMYQYVFIVDGKLIDTKKMMVGK